MLVYRLTANCAVRYSLELVSMLVYRLTANRNKRGQPEANKARRGRIGRGRAITRQYVSNRRKKARLLAGLVLVYRLTKLRARSFCIPVAICTQQQYQTRDFPFYRFCLADRLTSFEFVARLFSAPSVCRRPR
jgi:hypothetical protein